MSINVAYDLWTECCRYMSTPDRADAADALVNVLIDNDYEVEDILAVFKTDSYVRQALQTYLDDTVQDTEEEDDDDQSCYDED
jgi:hypothetical protein